MAATTNTVLDGFYDTFDDFTAEDRFPDSISPEHRGRLHAEAERRIAAVGGKDEKELLKNLGTMLSKCLNMAKPTKDVLKELFGAHIFPAGPDVYGRNLTQREFYYNKVRDLMQFELMERHKNLYVRMTPPAPVVGFSTAVSSLSSSSASGSTSNSASSFATVPATDTNSVLATTSAPAATPAVAVEPLTEKRRSNIGAPSA